MAERLEDTLRRLKEERDEADRRYNEALTALDRSVRPPGELPDPVAPFDTQRMAALNEAWNIVTAPPAGGGLRGRLTSAIWGTVAPSLQRQLTFNSWLVDHLNRNTAAASAAQQRSEQTLAALRQRLAQISEFQSRLLVYLQQITAYVDTKDRQVASGTLVLNSAISNLADSLDKRSEAMTTREQRMDARTHELSASLERTDAELRGMIAVSHQASLALKREVERLLDSGAAGSTPAVDASAAAPASDRAFAPALDAYKYVGFEDRFRGSRELILERLASYLPFFAGASDVLDVGCGRGEFLELLAGAGVTGHGIDLNHEMVEVCRSRGLSVSEGDAVGYLSARADDSLGGLFAAQVVEHLEPSYLLRFLELAFHKLRPGARLVLETLNPACWVAFFDSYIRDITHRWPLHPDTLQYLVLASGFSRADIEFRSPVPPEDRLQTLAVPVNADPAVSDVVETFNANVDKLNRRLFTHLDYAIIGLRA